MNDIRKRTHLARRLDELEKLIENRIAFGKLEAKQATWIRAYVKERTSGDNHPHPEGIASLLPK